MGKNEFEARTGTRPADGESGIQEVSAAAILAEILAPSKQVGGDENATLDKYHGHGGSYVVDDATQARRPNK